MNDLSPRRADKFRQYRARKKAAGMRELRLWVPDINSPEMQARITADIKAIADARDEREVMDWIEAVTADVWKDMD